MLILVSILGAPTLFAGAPEAYRYVMRDYHSRFFIVGDHSLDEPAPFALVEDATVYAALASVEEVAASPAMDWSTEFAIWFWLGAHTTYYDVRVLSTSMFPVHEIHWCPYDTGADALSEPVHALAFPRPIPNVPAAPVLIQEPDC